MAAVTRNLVIATLPSDAYVVSGDSSRPLTLSSALRGVDAVLISPRALGDATAGVATVELLALAAAQGVKRVVALSAATVEYPAGYRRFADGFRAVEDAVKASGLQWTIRVRPTTPPTPSPGTFPDIVATARFGALTARQRPRRSTSGTSPRLPYKPYGTRNTPVRLIYEPARSRLLSATRSISSARPSEKNSLGRTFLRKISKTL